MQADYHMHLERDDVFAPCPYTPERVARYVGAAQDRRLAEIGITEHSHRFEEFQAAMSPLFQGARGQHPSVAGWLSRDFGERLERYVEAVLEARRAGHPVRLGIEVDYVPGSEPALARALEGVPWDYVVGSVHFVDGRSIDFAPEVTWPGADVDELYERYFQLLAQAASCGLFDVVAHPDLPKKFGHRPRQFPVRAWRAFLDAAVRARVVLEINTAGLRRPAAEVYPAARLLAQAVAAGLDVQMGSDAHDPGEVGLGFEQALEAARRAGVRRLVRWEGRRRRYQLL